MSLRIHTKSFGEIEISQKQIILFPNGLFGFESYKKFALIEESEESPFKWLQSLEDASLAFIVMQPELFLSNYNPIISIDELKEIYINSLEEALIMVIVTIPNQDIMQMTANLQGPILINPRTSIARQFISRDDSHIVKKQIFEQSMVEKV